MARPRLPLRLGIVLGLALGSGLGAWILRRAAPAAHSSAIGSAPLAPVPVWSWRDSATPPRLADPATASAALAAWRALRGPDGEPADFATRAAALRALLLRLPDADYPRLIDTLAAETSPDADALRQLAFASWIELDPSAATRWASARPGWTERFRDALGAWATRDARAAAAWACSLSDEKIADDLAGETLAILAESDASAALAFASAQGEAFLKAVLPHLLPVLARRDPAGTVQTYGPLLWNQGEGLFLLRDALGAWANRDPAATIAWVVSQPRRLDWDCTGNLSYLDLKPENRARFAQALLAAPDLARRHDAVGGFLFNWVIDDASPALAWITQLPDAHLRATLLDRALANHQESGRPDRLLSLALALPEGENREQHFGRILEKWAQNAPTEALRWIEAHADDPDVAPAFAPAQAALLGAIARDEPATAVAQWQALPEGPVKTAGLHAIATAWGRVDPAAALQWQAAQASPDRPASLSRDLIFRWARQDSTTALRWAETLPDKLRDHALFSLANENGNRLPPATAVDLYARIREPALRAEFVTAHAIDWLVTDRPAATAWLEKSDALTPEQVAALLAPSTK